jgi:diacylglycerol kinase family enzyme
MLQDGKEAKAPEHARKPGLRVIVLLNARAGAANHRGANIVRTELEEDFQRFDVATECEFCSGWELKALAEKALASAREGKIDAIVVGGGDGSVRTVAATLGGTGVPLGILPLGTLNHFAKDLGIPHDLEEAALVIAKGARRVVDLAEVNGEIFINNSSVGIYPYIVIDRERRRAHHKLAKWIAMIAAMFRALRHFPRRRLALSAEGWTRPYRTPCLFVGNNDYGMDLFTLGRRRHLDQADLSVHVVKQRRPFGFFWMICRLCFGHATTERDIESFKLKELEVRSKTSRLPVALDGEVEIMHPPLRYRTRPGALVVIAPASHHGEQAAA